MRRRSSILYRLFLLFAAGGTVSCGPTIQLINVDVKLPAAHPVSFDNRNIAVFNALYDTTGAAGAAWNDSLLINKVAEGFRDQLAADLSMEPDAIPVYNHFCGRTSGGTLDDKAYIYSLSAQTGVGALVLIDSVRHGDFQHIPTKTTIASAYRPTYVSAEWQMVFRFFDMDKDRFTAYLTLRDTLYWNILAKDVDSPLIDAKLAASLPAVARQLGIAVAQITQPQWETQERVLFFFTGRSWYKALEHAFLFEWEEARDSWLALTKEAGNYKKVGYAAYNLAVACEMLGHIDLAKEWLSLARQYVDIPEIKHYAQMLDERKQQQRHIVLPLDGL